MSGVTVEVVYGGGFSSSPATCPLRPTACWFIVKTGPSGSYDVAFDSSGPGPSGGVGTITAFGPDWVNLQIVPVAPTTIVQNFRLKQVPRINVGQQTTVNVEPDSSLCTDTEDLYALTFRCEVVMVSVGQSGTLIIEARATTGSVVPSMFWATSGNYNGPPVRSGPGTLSIPVRGGSFQILVGTPVGSGAQQFTVQTSLR